MKIVKDISEIALCNSIVTVGNFDGVHAGHKEIFRRVKQSAAKVGGSSVVVTFVPHPLKVLASRNSPKLITTYTEKETLIEVSGIEYLVEINFDRQFAATSARDFVAEILVGKLGMKKLFIGYDYVFGHNRQGNVALLAHLGKEFSFEVEELQPISHGETIFSSTAIRNMIAEGDVKNVVPLLGRHFSVRGTVIHGRHRGKGLGFPTANLATDKELLPKDGVYAVKVKIEGLFYDGACNIGTNPTFNDQALAIEVFLFDFEGDLYGKEVVICFIDRIRDEKVFSDASSLQQAIADDIRECRDILDRASVIEYIKD